MAMFRIGDEGSTLRSEKGRERGRQEHEGALGGSM
jgi:hypothetical protein